MSKSDQINKEGKHKSNVLLKEKKNLFIFELWKANFTLWSVMLGTIWRDKVNK